ncbi:MAG: hypothetical protein WD294_05690 [Phycisphaeraceae bacterium]
MPDVVAPAIPHLDVVILTGLLLAVGKVADLEDRSVPLWLLIALGIAAFLSLVFASDALGFFLAGIVTFAIMMFCKAREGL